MKKKSIAPPISLRMSTNKYNYQVKPGRKIASRSMTIQNDSPTLANMLGKLIQGMPTRIQPGVYPDDMTHEDPDFQKAFQDDPVDRENVLIGIKAMTERLKYLKKEYEEDIKARKLAEDDASKQAGNADGV